MENSNFALAFAELLPHPTPNPPPHTPAPGGAALRFAVSSWKGDKMCMLVTQAAVVSLSTCGGYLHSELDCIFNHLGDISQQMSVHAYPNVFLGVEDNTQTWVPC